MKAHVDIFNQEKALVGAFSVVVKLQTSRRFVSSSSPDLQTSSVPGLEQANVKPLSWILVTAH